MQILRWTSAILFLSTALVPSRGIAQSVFSRNLRLGDQGFDVVLLQKILNSDEATRLALTGPGAPGQESTFFGGRTRTAVIKFQEKYAAEILVPSGLVRGTGFVGAATQKKLGAIYTGGMTAKLETAMPAIPKIVTSTPINPKPAHPNSENLDYFLDRVKKVQVQSGKSETEAQGLADSIRQIALSTTTDFKAHFFQNVLSVQPRALSKAKPGFRSVFSFKVPIAHAQVAFGGPLLYAMPCTCSATALVTIGPPVPSYLDYVYGTQSFLNFTAPYAAFFLGLYTPGSGETCYMYIGYGCTLIPSEGLITPVLGTS